MEPLTWIHISDLHRGQPGEARRWPVLREQLLADMRAMAGMIGVPDFILCTGDLAYSGRAEEYAAVDQTLEQFIQALTLDGGAQPPLLVPVPGNHDLARPSAKDVIHSLLERYQADPELRRECLTAGSGIHSRLRGLFASYQDWFNRSILPRWESEQRAGRARYQAGPLPGDFALGLHCRSWQVGIVGMNSAFLQLRGGSYERQLALEPEQHADPDLPSFIANNNTSFLLMHHPPAWLHPRCEKQFERYIYPPDSFLACFFGHMHTARAQSIQYSAGTTRRYWQGTSLFGLEGSASQELREVGYVWYRLTRLTPERGVLERWARRGAQRDDGSLALERDPASSHDPWTMELSLRPCQPAPSTSRPPRRGAPPFRNPFLLTGKLVDPALFIGREALVAELLDCVRNGVNRSLVGESQIGKSSILAVLPVLAERAGVARDSFLYLDLQTITDAEDFFAALCDGCGIPRCRGYELVRALRHRRHVLCLDEVEKLRSEQFGYGIRQLLRGLADGTSAPLTLLVASRVSLQQLFPDTPEMTSPLYNICIPMSIPPFALTECRALVQSRLQDTGVSFSDQEIADIHARACGNPGLIEHEAGKVFALKMLTETVHV